MENESLEIIISENESYSIYDDGVFYSHQSDKNENPTDIPQYLFELRDFVQECERKKIKKNIGQLRQYLNERTSDKLVTNKELETFLISNP